MRFTRGLPNYCAADVQMRFQILLKDMWKTTTVKLLLQNAKHYNCLYIVNKLLLCLFHAVYFVTKRYIAVWTVQGKAWFKNLIAGNNCICFGRIWMGSVQKRGADFQLQKGGLGKPIAVPRSLFWLLCLLIRGVPLLFSSFWAAAWSYTELCLDLPSFLLWLGLFNPSPYLPISNKYFSFSFAVSVVSDNFL